MNTKHRGFRRLHRALILTPDMCKFDLSESYYAPDAVETLRNNLLSHLSLPMLDVVRKSDSVVFRTPDGRYIGLKCRWASPRTLDRI